MKKKAKQLWQDYKITGDPTSLIVYYSPFARAIARTKHGKLPSFVGYEDIENSAITGLWMAIERFDTSLGVKFEAFARQRILGSIIDDIREEDTASRSIRDTEKEIKAAEQTLTSTLMRVPDENEIAAYLKRPVEELRDSIMNLQASWFLTTEPADPGGNDVPSDIPGRLQEFYTIDNQDVLDKILGIFTKREKLIFTLMYFEGLTLEEVAVILGLTHPLACQMHFRMIDQLKAIKDDI